MTWGLQRVFNKQKKNRMRNMWRSSPDRDVDNRSDAEEVDSEVSETLKYNSVTPRKRLSHDNLNQHMRKSNYGEDNTDNASVSSVTFSLFSVDHLKEDYTLSRHEREIRVLRASLQKLRAEKDSLQAMMLKEKTEKEIVSKLLVSKNRFSVPMRREIFWNLQIDDKFSFHSSPFSFLDNVWNLQFIRTTDEAFGFFIELLNSYSSDQADQGIYIMALFKLHHNFAQPYQMKKTEPFKFCEGDKRGLINFVTFDNLMYYIQSDNIVKLSVVLELAN